MNYKLITTIIIIAAVVGLVAWDIVAYFKGGGDATISELIWVWSKDYPFIPFLGGVLVGHLWTVPPRKA